MKRSNRSVVIQNLAKMTLTILLKEFIERNRDEQILLSKIIDEYASILLVNFKKDFSDEFQECIEGFLTFHHWADFEIPPQYTLKDVKKILHKLQTEF